MSTMIDTMRERAVGDLRQAADAIESASAGESPDVEAIRNALSQAQLGCKTGNELARTLRRQQRAKARAAERKAARAEAGE